MPDRSTVRKAHKFDVCLRTRAHADFFNRTQNKRLAGQNQRSLIENLCTIAMLLAAESAAFGGAERIRDNHPLASELMNQEASNHD
jgi:hypothetical protein